MPTALVGLSCTVVVVLAACTSGGSDPAAVPSAPARSSVPSSSTATSGASASSSSGAPSSGAPSSAAAPAAADWPTYHGDLLRTGVSTSMPAASGRLTAEQIKLDAQVYASPIVVGSTVFVATERNSVYAISPSGTTKWSVNLGVATRRSSLPCGNIDPLGITGTPIYDAATSTLFVVASIGNKVRHDLVALDPTNGAVKWRRSVDLAGTDPQAMQQRGALTIVDGRVWVPFGGLAGDCGAYKGRVVGVPLSNGPPIEYTVPTTREAGIWTPPGPTVFNGRMFVAVGNGESVGGTYDFSDSVLELAGDRLVDSFSPSSWASDNKADLDLGSQGPAVVSGRWIFIAGKSGTAYVLKIGALGQIGGEVSQSKVCRSFGGTAVLGDTVYVPCTDGLRAVSISATGTMTIRWHAGSNIAGSPVVGGGRVYALDQSAGVLHALDPASGRPREQVTVGETSRFATPAISGSQVFVPTLTGLTIVETAR